MNTSERLNGIILLLIGGFFAVLWTLLFAFAQIDAAQRSELQMRIEAMRSQRDAGALIPFSCLVEVEQKANGRATVVLWKGRR